MNESVINYSGVYYLLPMKLNGINMRNQESIWEQEQRLKEEAKKLAEQNKDKPVTKYLLK